ncbi:DUF4832 domain-containing protein, partial [Cellulophaga sp. Hel_I_12]|uniref:DUF4832 domain-containing protein n=1 Tax=Cellulophaga sp. Hel_I_12 TaxID=1249972 RepID=UPI00064834E5
MKFLTVGLLFLMVNSSCQSNGDSPNEETEEIGINKISYTVSNDVFSNPERGFMHSLSVASEGTPLNEVYLANLKGENVTLILRLYNLEKFKETALSETQLNLIKTDFERLRNAGIKCVLRFAYNENQESTDAALNVIETHLDQLKPIFAVNADVIAFVQAGFIGSWGEWYYTTNGLTSIENKKAVMTKLLDAFPPEIKIQLRTPLYKQQIFNYSSAMNADVGYSLSDIARVGFHNDCFLASSNDYGTYENVIIEKQFISQEALYVPTGGETCPPSGIPLATCLTATSEMELLKWTYLNLDYYGPVLQGWKDANCFNDFQRKLGYRLAFQSAEFSNMASSSFQINVTINNIGFAPVYNTKNTNLVFRSKTTGAIYKKKLTFDVRKVIPKISYNLSETVSLSNIPADTYELLMEINDASSELAERNEYKIRLANTNVWEAETGFNKLGHTLIIN